MMALVSLAWVLSPWRGVLVVGLVEGTNSHTQWQCDNYAEMTQQDTKFIRYDACYVKGLDGKFKRYDSKYRSNN